MLPTMISKDEVLKLSMVLKTIVPQDDIKKYKKNEKKKENEKKEEDEYDVIDWDSDITWDEEWRVKANSLGIKFRI